MLAPDRQIFAYGQDFSAARYRNIDGPSMIISIGNLRMPSIFVGKSSAGEETVEIAYQHSAKEGIGIGSPFRF